MAVPSLTLPSPSIPRDGTSESGQEGRRPGEPLVRGIEEPVRGIEEPVREVDPSLPQEHHMRRELCTNRPPYRDGRRLRAVKVYTVSQESRYLLFLQIPQVSRAVEDLVVECALYGAVQEYKVLHEYPTPDPFTDALWVRFTDNRGARKAKRELDNRNYRGGVLHVCYAPEYERVSETRDKLSQRWHGVTNRLRALANEDAQASSTNLGADSSSELAHLSKSGIRPTGPTHKGKIGGAGGEQGPRLPPRVEERRRVFHMSETGDLSLDLSVTQIRSVVSSLSTPPLQRPSHKKSKKS